MRQVVKNRRRTSRWLAAARRGSIIVYSALLMIVMMAMLALSVDVGYIYTMQAQLQRAVDAAALAGAGDLVEGVEQAQATAKEYLVRNPVGSTFTVVDDDTYALAMTEFDEEYAEYMDLKTGNWNPVTRELEETSVMPSSLTVAMEYPNLPLFFARALGRENVTIRAQSTAMFQPRDIQVVLDFSGSMNDDSLFSAIGKLGRTNVESSLFNCWNDLGPPSYGNLAFMPRWASAHGVAENAVQGIPHVTVEYRDTSVYVTSTKTLTTVRLQYSNGNTQNFTGAGLMGTFAGTGSNANKQVRKVWVKSWNNTNQFGTYGEPFDFTTNATFRNALGLSGVAYPYAGFGSWDGYIDYVESSSSNNTNHQAGYRYRFGGMNLMNYWLEMDPEADEMPDGWKCRAEPVAALKSAFDVFMDFIAAVDTGDRVGLSIYNAPNGEGLLENGLTDDYGALVNVVNRRQAGHYHLYTNTGGGLHNGREHLDAEGRANARKMIVLMTDGLSNWRNGSFNVNAARQYVLDEAALCAHESRKYKIMTISLGVGADTEIMQQVADMTGGKHFNVPGGSSHQEMYEQLYAAFEEIAKARPLRLVQ